MQMEGVRLTVNKGLSSCFQVCLLSHVSVLESKGLVKINMYSICNYNTMVRTATG